MNKSPQLVYIFMGLIFMAFFIFSCGNKSVYQQSFEVNNGTWTYSDSASFDLSSILNKVDTSNIYQLDLEVTHQNDFPFRNLYVEINSFSQKVIIDSRRISLELADATGTWLGKCSGQKCTYRINLKEDFLSSPQLIDQITIQQSMRQSPTYGVDELTLYLTIKD